jgi:hypothetical protein
VGYRNYDTYKQLRKTVQNDVSCGRAFAACCALERKDASLNGRAELTPRFCLLAALLLNSALKRMGDSWRTLSRRNLA